MNSFIGFHFYFFAVGSIPTHFMESTFSISDLQFQTYNTFKNVIRTDDATMWLWWRFVIKAWAFKGRWCKGDLHFDHKHMRKSLKYLKTTLVASIFQGISRIWTNHILLQTKSISGLTPWWQSWDQHCVDGKQIRWLQQRNSGHLNQRWHQQLIKDLEFGDNL